MSQFSPSAYVRENYAPIPESGCWIWLGGVDARGYGITTKKGGQKMKAHRAFYEMHVGPIPDGKIICHKCNTTSCVNPDHLYAGCAKTNAFDRGMAGRHAVAKLSPEDVMEIRSLLGADRVTSIAKRFNVSRATIYAISTGRTWSQV